MLTDIRRHSEGLAVKILLVLIIASFALWGVEGVGGGSIPPVSKVGGSVVTQQEFSRHLNNAVNSIAAQRNGSYTLAEAAEEGLPRNIAERLVAIRSVDLAAESMGLRASDKMVRDYIFDIPSVQSTSGSFDSLSYRELLQNQRLRAGEFEEDMRREIARNQLLDTLQAGIRTPEAMYQAFFKFTLEQRAASYFVVYNDRMSGIDRPADDVLEAHYEEHEGEFTAPEYRALSFISIRVPDIVGTIEIDDSDIEAAYEDRIREFTTEAERNVKRIRLDSEDAANAMSERFAGGLSFDDAVAETGQIAGEVNLGNVGRENLEYLGEDSVNAVFELGEGEISEPLETDLGWMIFTIDSFSVAAVTPLEEVADRIAADLKIDRAERKVEDLANLTVEELAAGAGLEELAETLGLPLRKVSSIDRSGLDSYGNVVAAAPTSRAFFDAAFQKVVGEDIDIEETEGGGYFVAQVDEITPSTLRPFDEVKGKVHDSWLAIAREDKAAEVARGMAERANEGEDLADLAREVGTFVEQAPSVRRSMQGAPNTFSFDLVGDLFGAEPGTVVTGSTALDNGHVVAKLTAVASGDPEAAATESASLRLNLSRSFERDILREFERHLLAKYDPSTSQTVIDTLIEQSQ